MQVGILGYGTLGRAIAAGLMQHDGVRGIMTTTRHGAPPPELPHVEVLGSNAELARCCDVVLICVKPFQVEAVTREIAPELASNKLLISTAASVTTSQVRGWSGDRSPVMRAMPNMPCRIGEGMTVLATGAGASAEHAAIAESLFATLGRATTIDEGLMDAATGISGCGPAYMYLILEALSDAGVKLGLPRALARELVAQTMLGSAKLALESHLHVAALKDQVTTPAGCTVDGLMELEDGKLRSTLLRAAVAAATRSASLASS